MDTVHDSINYVRSRLASTVTHEQQTLKRLLGDKRLAYIISRVATTTNRDWLSGNCIFLDVVLNYRYEPIQLYLRVTYSLFVTAIATPFTVDLDRKDNDNMANNIANPENEPRFVNRARVSEIASEVWCLAFAAIQKREPSDVEYARIYDCVNAIVNLTYTHGVCNNVSHGPAYDTRIMSVYHGFDKAVKQTDTSDAMRFISKNLMQIVTADVVDDNIVNVDDNILCDPVFSQVDSYGDSKANFLPIVWSNAYGPFMWFWLHTTAARVANGSQCKRFYALLASFDFAIQCGICRHHFNSSPLIVQIRKLVSSHSFDSLSLDINPSGTVYTLHARISKDSNDDKNIVPDVSIISEYTQWWTVALPPH